MPSDQSTWLIAVPQDGDSEGLLPEITAKLSQQSRSTSVAELSIPSFKVSSVTPINTQISSRGWIVLGRHPRLAYITFGGAAQAGISVHCGGGQDRRYPP